MLRLIFPIIMLLAVGCTHRVYVPYEIRSSLSDSAYRVANTADTLILRDSVTTFINGDTVLIQSVRDRLRTRLRVDTVLRTISDTITTTRTITVEKEKPRSTMQKAINATGIISLVVIILIAARFIVRYLSKNN